MSIYEILRHRQGKVSKPFSLLLKGGFLRARQEGLLTDKEPFEMSVFLDIYTLKIYDIRD